MQTHSVILWMKREDFYLYKRFLDGGVMWRDYQIYTMLMQVGPSSTMDALVRAENLCQVLNPWE